MESAYHALGGIGRGKKRLRNCDSWRRCGGEVLVTSRAEARVCPRGAKSATADANLYDAYFGSTSWTQTATPPLPDRPFSLGSDYFWARTLGTSTFKESPVDYDAALNACSDH